MIGPSASWYEPPEPRICCDQYEEPDHDNDQCWADQAEAAAERRAEELRDRERDWDLA